MSTQKGASIMNSIVMEAFRAKAAVGNDQWKGVGAILRKAIDERPGAPAGETTADRPESAATDAANAPKAPHSIPDCVCALLRRSPGH